VISAVIAADAAKRAAFASIGVAETKLKKFQADLRKAEIELQENDQQAADAMADALIDGASVNPPAAIARRKSRIESRIAGYRAALPKLQTAIEDARRAHFDTEAPYVAACLSLITAMQDKTVENTRGCLAKLASHFSRMIAADIVRDRTIGDRFEVPNGMTVPPALGSIARNFIATLPKRLRPDGLTDAALMSEAQRIADKFSAIMEMNP
jgi:hypothetical protein